MRTARCGQRWICHFLACRAPRRVLGLLPLPSAGSRVALALQPVSSRPPGDTTLPEPLLPRTFRLPEVESLRLNPTPGGVPGLGLALAVGALGGRVLVLDRTQSLHLQEALGGAWCRCR